MINLYKKSLLSVVALLTLTITQITQAASVTLGGQTIEAARYLVGSKERIKGVNGTPPPADRAKASFHSQSALDELRRDYVPSTHQVIVDALDPELYGRVTLILDGHVIGTTRLTGHMARWQLDDAMYKQLQKATSAEFIYGY